MLTPDQRFEEAILRALDGLPPYSNADVTVKTPRVLHFDADTDTQILEDLPDSVDLKTFLLSSVSSGMSKSSAESLGRALGSWLRSFHDWGSNKDQAGCKATLSKNESMKELKFWVNYTILIDTIANFPHILEKSRHVFEEVRDFAAAELTKQDHDDEYGIIHGDFWTGKYVYHLICVWSLELARLLTWSPSVLIPNVALSSQSETTLFVIDWELSQIGSRALDLGQMIAELYETELFKRSEAGVWIIEGLLEGYGHMSDEMAFRTAIHVGVHLVCWGSRVPGWGSKEQIEEVVKIGNDLIVQGWAKNKEWLELPKYGRH